jgi:hypothetical protein
MFKLNEKSEIKKFVRKERIVFLIYILYIAAVIFGKITFLRLFLVSRDHDIFRSEESFDILFSDEITPVVIMSLIFMVLLFQLYKYHRYEFQQHVVNMVFFFILETVLLVTVWIGNINQGATQSVSSFSKVIILNLGVYPIQQAYCLIILKMTKDPLEGVSILDFVFLVSITQRYKQNHIEEYQDTEEWKQLSKEERKQYIKAWLE